MTPVSSATPPINEMLSLSSASFFVNANNDISVQLGTFYFPGWKVYLDKSLEDQIIVNEIGTMDINLPKGNHNLDLRFENTNIRNLSLVITNV